MSGLLPLPDLEACPAAGDDTASARLRLLAWALAEGEDLSRLGDHELLARLVVARASGRLHSAADDPPALMRLVSAPVAAASAAAAAGPRRALAVEPALAVETTFGADLDAPAMAAALVQAAQDGVPFCEECAKAAAQAAAARAAA